jgi:hypothetical protein
MRVPLTAGIALLLVSISAWADKFADALQDFRAAMGTRAFFPEAYGYAGFPTIGRGGIGIGGV